MSKELIEKLHEGGKFLGGNFGKLMHEAADALEAKAAPVGEPSEASWAAIDWFRAPEQAELRKSCAMGWAVYCFRAGAAHQRAQQPQSAEAVNRAHVMDALLMWNRRHEVPPINIGYEYGVAGAVLDLVATPQPSAGVVMPDVDDLAAFIRQIDGNNRMGAGALAENICEWLARLNGKEVVR